MTAMTARQHRTIIFLLCIAVALCISFALSSIPRQLGMSAAHAQAFDTGSGSALVAPSIPDPVTSPIEALSSVDKLYHSGAYLLLGIVLVFMGLRWASQHVAWLEVPNRAHYVTALLAGLALVAVPASQGATPNLSMIVVAIGTVISLCAPGAKSVPRQGQAGRASIVVTFAIAAVSIGLGIACAVADLGKLMPTGLTLAADVAAKIKGNAPTLTADLDAAAVTVGVDAVKCAIAAAAAVLLAPSGSGAAAGLPPGLLVAQEWAAKQ